LLGVRSWPLLLVPVALWWVAGFAAWLSRLDYPGQDRFPYVTVLASLALAASTVLHGPLMVIPAIAAVHSMAMALTTERRHRRFALVAYALGVVVPTFFVWRGWHPVAHRVVGGVLQMQPGAISFPFDGTSAYLTLAHVVILLVAARFAASYRDTLTEAQTRNELLSWQLRQLVPDEAARAAFSSTSEPRLRASK